MGVENNHKLVATNDECLPFAVRSSEGNKGSLDGEEAPVLEELPVVVAREGDFDLIPDPYDRRQEYFW